jgi:hypothetical protein
MMTSCQDWLDFFSKPCKEALAAGKALSQPIYKKHELVMSMVLDPAKIVFREEHIADKPGRHCSFQYQGVNLYTSFRWDGSSKQYDAVKETHINETIKYLAQHGIAVTLGL